MDCTAPAKENSTEFCTTSWKSKNTVSCSEWSTWPNNFRRGRHGTSSDRWSLLYGRSTGKGSRTATLNLKIYCWIPNSTWKLWISGMLVISWINCNIPSSTITPMPWGRSRAMRQNLSPAVAKECIKLMRSMFLQSDASSSNWYSRHSLSYQPIWKTNTIADWQTQIPKSFGKSSAANFHPALSSKVHIPPCRFDRKNAESEPERTDQLAGHHEASVDEWIDAE